MPDKWDQYATPATPDKWDKYAAPSNPRAEADATVDSLTKNSTVTAPGFVQSGAEASGLQGLLHPIQTGKAMMQEQDTHPIRSIAKMFGGPAVQAGEGLISGGKRIFGELGEAAQSAKEGNPYGFAAHQIQALPFIGGAIKRGTEQMPAYNGLPEGIAKAATNPGVLGTAVGTAAATAPMILGAADMAAPGRAPLEMPTIPSRARAGKLFESVMGDAQNQPVNLTRSNEPLMRTFEMGQRGAQLPKVVRQLVNRTTEPGAPPLTYREARDFGSNLSQMSSKEAGSLKPAIRRQVGEASHAFNQDVGDAAAAAGRGEDYANAMREYARASQLRSGLKTAAKIAIPTLGLGLAGKIAHEYLPK
jgi:hypothetical protein